MLVIFWSHYPNQKGTPNPEINPSFQWNDPVAPVQLSGPTLRESSYWKFIVFPTLAKFVSRYNRYISNVGRNRKDYLNHLSWIINKFAENNEKYEAYLVVNPGKNGKLLLDLVSKDALTDTGFTVIDGPPMDFHNLVNTRVAYYCFNMICKIRYHVISY